MANRLADATSPYLLQHAENPVHWQEWGPTAFAEAEARDVPILLSVGYAACHWCHVMAHESFEDEAIAAQMNADFVNIKLDREERPDLDAVYQQALALLGQQGGWPLTMFLTPRGEPFWGGTYFPPSARYGRAGFPDVLRELIRLWRDERGKLLGNRDQMQAALQQLASPRPGAPPAPDQALSVAQRLAGAFDPVDGGLKGAPKFPQAPILNFLWQADAVLDEGTLRQTVMHTLERICQGGIFDHLGGGFSRYSVDNRWLVPHFEKMLYDNGQLLDLLAKAWLLTGNPLFRERAAGTVEWLQREMLVEGALAASLDADSEGEEGRFYVWTEEEIRSLLGEEARAFQDAYDVKAGGNFEGRSILNRLHVDGLTSVDEEIALVAAREKLLVSRETRPRPARDDKILADWNGLAIYGLVLAGTAMERADWVTLAANVFQAITDAGAADGRLAHSRRQGRAREQAFLDDYAAMMRSAIALASATGDAAYLDHAERWAGLVDRDFRDSSDHFYQTAAASDGAPVRPRGGTDGPAPSGAALLAGASLSLWMATGKEEHRARAEAIFTSFGGDLREQPLAHAGLLEAVLFAAHGRQIVVAGAGDEAEALLTAARRQGIAEGAMVSHVLPGQALPESHPAAGKGLVDGRAAAYICEGFTCRPPIRDAAELARALEYPQSRPR